MMLTQTSYGEVHTVNADIHGQWEDAQLEADIDEEWEDATRL